MGFIDSINTTLTDMFGPFGPLLVVGLLGVRRHIKWDIRAV